MTVTAVVRLLDGPLRRGELVGWVEATATDDRVPVRNAQELVDALGSLAPDPVATVSSSPPTGADRSH